MRICASAHLCQLYVEKSSRGGRENSTDRYHPTLRQYYRTGASQYVADQRIQAFPRFSIPQSCQPVNKTYLTYPSDSSVPKGSGKHRRTSVCSETADAYSCSGRSDINSFKRFKNRRLSYVFAKPTTGIWSRVRPALFQCCYSGCSLIRGGFQAGHFLGCKRKRHNRRERIQALDHRTRQ